MRVACMEPPKEGSHYQPEQHDAPPSIDPLSQIAYRITAKCGFLIEGRSNEEDKRDEDGDAKEQCGCTPEEGASDRDPSCRQLGQENAGIEQESEQEAEATVEPPILCKLEAEPAKRLVIEETSHHQNAEQERESTHNLKERETNKVGGA